MKNKKPESGEVVVDGIRIDIDSLTPKAKTPAGKGWHTKIEWEKIFKFGSTKTHQVLKRLIQSGTWEAFTGSQDSGLDRMVRQVWYRQKP
jgi:hypothetical protein